MSQFRPLTTSVIVLRRETHEALELCPLFHPEDCLGYGATA
jgi:hypothetical protein